MVQENGYYPVRAVDPLWLRLSTQLRGQLFRVPYRWRRGGLLGFRDWSHLVREGLVGQRVYLEKTYTIDYRKVLKCYIKS